MTVLSQKIAKIYQDEIWKLHRIPREVLSNKEPQFTLKFIEELSKALETKRILSIVYHFQTCCSNHSPEWHSQYANFSKALQQTISQQGLQENSTRSPHYIIHYIYTWLLVCATTISIWPLSPCIFLMSSYLSYYLSTCVFHRATILPTCALTLYLHCFISYVFISIIHAYTMCAL